MSRKELAALGVVVTDATKLRVAVPVRGQGRAVERLSAKARGVARANAFRLACAVLRVPAPTPEFRFDPIRKWRFDWAWPDAKLALEVDGGIWVQGRHSRGSGQVKEMEKFNAAAVAGWRVLRCTPNQIGDPRTAVLVKRALGL